MLRHRNGINQIVGIFDDSVHQMRPRIVFGDEQLRVYADLAGVKEHYILYIEVSKFTDTKGAA